VKVIIKPIIFCLR